MPRSPKTSPRIFKDAARSVAGSKVQPFSFGVQLFGRAARQCKGRICGSRRLARM
ncbi:MAG TPA: hypothetical protein VF543_18250 [Pyrinomonadaceae bacterium]